MSTNLTIIDAAVTGFAGTVAGAAGRLAGALVAPVTAALVGYIIWMGYQIIFSKMDSPVATLALRALRISIIVAIALGVGVYIGTVYGSIQGAETLIISAMVPGATDVPTALGQSITDIWELVRAREVARTPVDTGPWPTLEFPDFEFLLFKIVVILGQIIMVVCGFIPYIIAKMTLMLLAMFGPLFIVCLIWPATNRFFESWVSAVVAAILTFGIIAALVGFVAPLIHNILEAAEGDTGTLELMAVALMIVPCQLIFAYLLWISGSLAGQLAGGGGSSNPLTSAVSTAMHHGMGALFRRGGGSRGGSIGGNGGGGGNAGNR